MIARTRLAALDHNANTGRQQATVTRGANQGELQYKLVFPKKHERVGGKTNYGKDKQRLSEPYSGRHCGQKKAKTPRQECNTHSPAHS